MARYKNPWHKSDRPEYGPEEYQTDRDPEMYRDFEIYERVTGQVFDIVQDGTCVGQYAGPNGARSAIDAYLDGTGLHYLTLPEKGGQEDEVRPMAAP